MKKLNKCGAGFTMIELLVVLAITVVLVGIGVMSMGLFSSRDNVASAKNELLSAIKLAKNYAMTMQSPAGYVDQLDYVAVIVKPSGVVEVYPVSANYGVGISYFSKTLGSADVKIGPVNFGDLMFSVPDGKLVERNILGSTPYAIQPRTAAGTVQIFLKSNASTGVGVADTQTVNIWNEGALDQTDSAINVQPTVTWFNIPTTIPH